MTDLRPDGTLFNLTTLGCATRTSAVSKNVDGPFQRHYLRAANVTWSGLDVSELKQMNFTEEEMSTYRLQPGDILVNEASGSASEVGKPALFSGEVDDCAFQNHLIRLRCHSIETNFLLHFLMKTAVNGEYVRRSQGLASTI